MKAARFAVVAGILVLAVLAASCQSRPQTAANAPARPTPQQIADSLARIAKIERGHVTFVSYCAMCHGLDGSDE